MARKKSSGLGRGFDSLLNGGNESRISDVVKGVEREFSVKQENEVKKEKIRKQEQEQEQEQKHEQEQAQKQEQREEQLQDKNQQTQQQSSNQNLYQTQQQGTGQQQSEDIIQQRQQQEHQGDTQQQEEKKQQDENQQQIRSEKQYTYQTQVSQDKKTQSDNQQNAQTQEHTPKVKLARTEAEQEEQAEQAQPTIREVSKARKPKENEATKRTSSKKTSNDSAIEVEIDFIQPNPDQPRKNFKKDELEELATSIEQDGVLQPILVRPMADGQYQIIAGERRWQAARIAGLKKIPVQIKETTDIKAVELALIENIQRTDLNPIEEAYSYRRIMEKQSLTQAELAQALSKGRSTVANALRLLDLPEEAQQLLFEEKITAGHARAILSVPSKEGKQKLTDKIVKDKLSVREAESIARLYAGNEEGRKADKQTSVPKSYKVAARAIQSHLETNVRIKTTKGKNKIEIEFKDDADLERVLKLIVGAKS